jgi:hypothetical protein
MSRPVFDGSDASAPALAIRIDSADLSAPLRPAWYDPPGALSVLDTADFGNDRPEALRSAGPLAVGTALYGLAEWGALSIRADVREVAALLREYLSDGLDHDSLDFDLGLRPRDGSPGLALLARRAERDRLVTMLARNAPFRDMGPWAAAGALRAACLAYEAKGWPRDRPPARRTAPAAEPVATFWRVLRMGLPQGPMPRQADLRRMIADDRERNPPC